MSGRADINVASRSLSDAGLSSGPPLPRSTMPLSRTDPKQQYDSLASPTLLFHHTTRPSSSPSISSAPAEPPRGVAVRNPLLQQKAGVYSHRRTDGTCSAYSSPQAPRREAPRSRDTMDLRVTSLTHQAVDLQLKRTTNRNWTFGKGHARAVDNAPKDEAICHPSPNVHVGHGLERQMHARGANGNHISGLSLTGMDHTQREVRNVSDQDLSVSKSRSSHHTFNMSRHGSEPKRVNMAAVSPFSFR